MAGGGGDFGGELLGGDFAGGGLGAWGPSAPWELCRPLTANGLTTLIVAASRNDDLER